MPASRTSLFPLRKLQAEHARDNICPFRKASTGPRNDVIKSEFLGWEPCPTILATEIVTKENIKSGEGWPARKLHIFLKRDDTWQLHVPFG